MDSGKGVDVSDLCDEVLLSPEEPTYINWDDVINFSDGEEDNEGRLSVLPAIEHLFIRNIDNLDKVNFSETQEMLLESLRKKTHNRVRGHLDQYWSDSNSSLRHALPKRTMKKEDKETKYLDSFLSGASKRGKPDFNEMTPRQKFWMRSSRSRWRRKVASADTSPEDPRRMRLSRGSSIEDRKSSFFNDSDDYHKRTFSYDDTNISAAVKPKTSKLHNVSISSTNFVESDIEEASPPSPHGMYTWPPQHIRHKHHGSLNEEDPEIYNHNKDFNDDVFQHENEACYPFRPVANGNSVHRPISSHSTKNPKNFDAESQANLKRKSFLAKKSVHRSLDYSDSSDMNDDLETSFNKTSSSYTNIRSIFNNYPEPLKVKESAIFSYPSRSEEIFDGESLNVNQNTTLSLLLSAKPISSLNSLQSSSSFISRDSDHIPSHEETEEDLYAVHKIPPTKARRDSDEIKDDRPQSYSPSFMQERSEQNYHSSRISPSTGLPNVYLGEDHYRAPLNSHSADSSYKEIRYHLAAAAAAAEQEWIESRRLEYKNFDQMNYDSQGFQMSSEMSPSYMVMDSAEFSPWSSPSPYPVGPLGASWLKHGFQSHTNSSLYHFPAPLIKSHSFSSRSFSPLSPQWYPTNHSSLHSLNSLDPTTDEFLVDAGIRIDESMLYNNIPPAPNYSTSCKTRNKLSNSRIRPPSVSSKIPVVGRIGDTASAPPKKVQLQSGPMKTRSQAIQRPSRPISGVSQQVSLTSNNVIGSRGKSLSHENLRSSSRLVLMASSSSAQTSPTTSRPTSPISSGSSLRAPNINSRVRKPQIVGGRSHGVSKPSSCGSSPSGSRCSSPGNDESKVRRGNTNAPSPVASRCTSPGRDDPLRSNNRRRVDASSNVTANSGRNRPSSSIPTVMTRGKGSSSKLPLPTSRK